VLNVDYTVWGWTHLVLGILAAATGLGLLAGNTVARVAGIVLAVISTILNCLHRGLPDLVHDRHRRGRHRDLRDRGPWT
jgi:hypothetical protein